MSKLNKKLIVTTNIKGLSYGKFRSKTKGMVQAQEDNPGVVTGLDPIASVVKGKIQGIDDKVAERKAIEQKKKDLTGEINDGITEVTNIMNDNWGPQVQKAANGDVNFVKLFGFGVKGLDDGESEPEVTIENSIPSIINIKSSSHLQQELEAINNITKKVGLPKGAKELAIFIFIGTSEPSDISKMRYLGATKRGKISHNFALDDAGKTAFYIAVYTSKATGKPVATTSIIAKLVII